MAGVWKKALCLAHTPTYTPTGAPQALLFHVFDTSDLSEAQFWKCSARKSILIHNAQHTPYLGMFGERVPDKPGTWSLGSVSVVWQSKAVERKTGWSWIVLSSALTAWTGRDPHSMESKRVS